MKLGYGLKTIGGLAVILQGRNIGIKEFTDTTLYKNISDNTKSRS